MRLGDISGCRDVRNGVAFIRPATSRDPDSAWRYVQIRRVAIFLDETLAEGTQWVVFEPDDAPFLRCLDYVRL
jgi:hypothetical protein